MVLCMRKTIVRMLTLVALVGGTAVVSATSVSAAKSDAKVQKLATSKALYKISTIKQTAPPPGCVGTGCPQIEQDVPAYEASSDFTGLAGAKKIDTYSVNQGPSNSFKGGCAINTSDKVVCWGSNTYGQLGDGKTTVANEKTLVEAKNLGEVIDVATNGFTTCAVTKAGEVKCVGKGAWPGFQKLQVYAESRVYKNVWNGTSYDETQDTAKSVRVEECQISDGTRVIGKTRWCGDQNNNYAADWVTILSSGVSKIQLGGSSGWDNSNICVLKTDGTVSCAKITPGTEGTRRDLNSGGYDCDGGATGDDVYEVPYGNQSINRDCFVESTSNSYREKATRGSISTYWRRDAWGNETPYSAPTWAWVDSELTGVKDFAMSSAAWGSDGSVCMIHGDDRAVTCRPFKSNAYDQSTSKTSGGEWKDKNVIAGVANAEKVYLANFGNGDGLCVYAAGTLSCGASEWDGTTNKFPTSVSTVAVMEQPLSIFSSSSSGGPGNVFFVTPSGILTAQSWIFNCKSCGGGQSKTLSNVGAFKDASATSYYYVESLSGTTDNADFIPANITTGARKILSQKAVKILANGATLASTDVRWTAPDAPDSLSSSSKATDKTDADGLVRLATLPTGPVAFTLKGGTLSNGTYLQAAMVIVNVPESGVVEVNVPVAADVVDRKVSVSLTDGTAVPNAVITLRNTYLTYNYANNGAATASWSATAPDTKGFMQTSQCAYCFVAPPTYITGADGSVTWKSFAPKSRSSECDAEVVYDDGSLNQKAKVLFTGTASKSCSGTVTNSGNTTAVQLAFMANIQTTMPAEVTPKADGSVEIPISLKDGDNLPISGLEAKAEEVCGEMQKGGLWSGSSSVQEGFCQGRGPGTSIGTPGTTSGVTKSGVSSFACAASSGTKTDSKGSATVKLCPSKSGYYRVRSSGVLPSKSICVKVNNQPCTVTLQNSIAGSTTSGGTSLTDGTTSGGTTSGYSAPTTAKLKSKTATSRFLKAYSPVKGAGAVKIVGTGACKVLGKSVVAGTKKGVCKVTITQAAKGKVKGAAKKVFTVKVA